MSATFFPSDLAAFDRLPAAEKIEFLSALWERVVAEPEAIEVPEEHLAELKRRIAEHERDPTTAIPWARARELLVAA
jgi:putative addiction module component (TIGR02574 family)